MADHEMQFPETDPVMADTPEPMPMTGRHDAQVVVEPAGGAGELVKFGLLAIVLLVTLAVIALLRPVIFDRIVPGVLTGPNVPTVRDIDAGGEDETDSDAGAPAANPDASDGSEAADPDATEPNGTDAAAPADLDSAGEDAAGATEPGTETNGDSSGEADAVEAADPATDADPAPGPATIYVVQAGDNLTKIAETFGVTTQAIIDANGLANPNQITAGTELIIPQP